MNKAEFDQVVDFLEGACRDHLKPKEREAYSLCLTPHDGRQVLKAAVDYVNSSRARYGFPARRLAVNSLASEACSSIRAGTRSWPTR